jgi:hypothetical protein
MSGTASGWKPNTNYVQSGIDGNRYVTAKYSLIAVGPPRLAQVGGAAAFAGSVAANGQQGIGEIIHPLGVVQQFSLSNSKQWSRIFEIGSERSYFIPGRAVGQLQLGRVFMHGASILRMMYAAFEDGALPTAIESMLPGGVAAAMSNPHNVIVPPGFENVFMNMGSDLFDQLFGLCWYIKDNNEDTMGANYFESCNAPNHGIQTDAQGLLYSESLSVQFERMIPVNTGTAVPLIAAKNTSDASGSGIDYPGLES